MQHALDLVQGWPYRSACAVQGLLTRVRDNNKHVQEAACSALATLEEAAGRELLESSRITAILKTLAAALQVGIVAFLSPRSSSTLACPDRAHVVHPVLTI